MKKLLTLIAIAWSLIFTGCHKADNVWDSVKTAGRYMNKSIDNLVGKPYNAHQAGEQNFSNLEEEDFIPLSDKDLKTQFAATDMAIPQPKVSLGEKGVPGIENFSMPEGELSTLFRNLHFNTDEHILRSKEDLLTVVKIAEYLKSHHSIYLAIEGHCDERAAASYNMALGTRRANYVRGLLVKHGVDLNRLYSISYGKEKPLALGHTTKDWEQNRRVQFKIHEM